MPSEYQCDECGLNFTIGWFHYHRFDSGYGSSTLLVCKACGTMHSVEHPVRKSSVTEILRVKAGPIFRPQRALFPTYSDWLEDVETCRRNIPGLACLHCGISGSLWLIGHFSVLLARTAKPGFVESVDHGGHRAEPMNRTPLL